MFASTTTSSSVIWLFQSSTRMDQTMETREQVQITVSAVSILCCARFKAIIAESETAVDTRFCLVFSSY